ncbi:hypothetical protein KQJ29_25565, partial [Enterococcus sp. S181_ASV_20]|nr:hypothetical protein [Enterococcus sp. S181_ASV_20]
TSSAASDVYKRQYHISSDLFKKIAVKQFCLGYVLFITRKILFCEFKILNFVKILKLVVGYLMRYH